MLNGLRDLWLSSKIRLHVQRLAGLAIELQKGSKLNGLRDSLLSLKKDTTLNGLRGSWLSFKKKGSMLNGSRESGWSFKKRLHVEWITKERLRYERAKGQEKRGMPMMPMRLRKQFPLPTSTRLTCPSPHG